MRQLALALAFSGQEIKNPDGTLAVKLTLDAGALTYEVAHHGRTVLEPAPLVLSPDRPRG